MVREVSSTEMSDSSSEESFSSSSFFSSSSESDYGIANRHRKFYESNSDSGRDKCQCQFDYRGEMDEIYCPRCRREVIEEFDVLLLAVQRDLAVELATAAFAFHPVSAA